MKRLEIHATGDTDISQKYKCNWGKQATEGNTHRKF